MAKNIFLGIDIGATKTIFLAVEFSKGRFHPQAHNILEVSKCATPHKEAEILKMIEENYKSLVKKYKITGIGIGFAGQVDYKKGAAIVGPNLKTGKIEFKKILEKKLKIPIAVENDARCFVLAESAFGAAKRYKNIVGLTIGTGIGGGIIIDGKIYRGATGSAGEFGHTDAGIQSELESMCSGKGISKIYKHLTGDEENSFEIVKLARQNDALALKTLEISAKNFGIGVANIIELLNSDIIVLGGGLSEVDLIVNKAKEYAKKKVFLPSLSKTPIVVSKLGPVAVALGAAWMAKGNSAIL